MKRWMGGIKRVLRWGLVVGIGVPFLAWLFLPWPITWRWRDPETTSFMEYRLDQAADRGEDYGISFDWVPLARISPDIPRAVILAEDQRFWVHGGIDWEAIGDELDYDGEPPFSWAHPSDWAAVLRAVGRGLRDRDEVKGRSTLTQQLAKNLYFTPRRTLRRKAGEFVVARRLEFLLDKDRILELYLNTAEFGPGIFGVEAASRHYFGVGASRLDRFQAATLAAILPHPLTSNPDRNPGEMAWRRDRILGLMGGAP